MYKIAICDDDKRYRKTIREIIEHENSLPENEIRFYEYESGNELLKHTDILHELVFIDIRMPGLDGNQTALKLRNYNKDAVLIFYSSYFEPTVDSINFGQPFRYIMKDLHDTSLRREIAAIMTEVKRRFLNDYAVTVTSAGKIIRIHVENILYVSRAKRGCEITIVKEQEKETVRCREAFGELCEQLKDQGFAQAHYSYIVKLGKVEGLIQKKRMWSYVSKQMGYRNGNEIEVLYPLCCKRIQFDTLYDAALAAYGYDIKKRMEKLRMKVVIMYGGNELFAAKSVSLVKEKCVSECEVYAYDNMGHSEVLSLHPEKLCEIIRK